MSARTDRQKVSCPARRAALMLCLAGILAASGPAAAQETLPPYHEQMARLAEVLGGLHYLRDLCGHGEGMKWRNRMVELLEAEKPGPLREADMIERFNRSYETFAATHNTCTDTTRRIMRDYLEEGAMLAATTRARYAD